MTFAGLVAAALASCESASPDSTSERGREARGDTVIVRAPSTGLWGESIEVVEELSIGTLDGADEYRFGLVTDIAVDETGGMYVFDVHAPALRYYDERGGFVRVLGRGGQGPGEYGDASLGVVVRRSDGRIVMRDPRNARLNVYTSEGEASESWPVGSSLYAPAATAIDDNDHLYLKILTGRPEKDRPWPIALLHLDDTGVIVDTVTPPVLPTEPDQVAGVFAVSKVWALARSGSMIVGVNDRYSLEVHRPDGTVLRIERDLPRPRVLPEERDEYEALNEWQRRTDDEDPPPVPLMKPMFRSIHVGEDGRIWVLRYVEARRGEPEIRPAPPEVEPPPPITFHEDVVYDVFEPDGSFLGTVFGPARTVFRVFRGDRIWGIRRGTWDEPQVVRFRIDHG